MVGPADEMLILGILFYDVAARFALPDSRGGCLYMVP